MCEGVPPRNSSQESVYRALEDFNPSLADLYEGARQMLAVDDPLPGWRRLVPHAVREIVGRIPAVLEIPAEPRLEYSERLKPISSAWQRAGLPVEGVGLTGGDDGGVSIPAELAEKIATLIRDHDQSSQQTMRGRLRGIASKLAPATGEAATNGWGDELHDVHRWAHGNTHERVASSGLPPLSEYRRQFGRLETALAGVLAEYGANKESLDDLLADTNRRAD